MRTLTQFEKHSARGFTVVEIMVAMTIALFLLAGLMTVVGSTRNAFGKQKELTTLQDSERMALSFIADMVQQAGYANNPLVVLTPGALTPLNGQYNVNAQGDTISVQFQNGNNLGGLPDGVLNCSGLANTTGTDQIYTNIFSVTPTGQLNCHIFETNTDYPLVDGVEKLAILYGVNLSGSGSNCSNCVQTYLNATEVTNASLWPNVISVKMTLTFKNTLYKLGQDTQPQTIDVSRVVTVMNQGGVKFP